MPALDPDGFAALLARRCACGRMHLRARAFATGLQGSLEGEPVGAVSWSYAPATLAERVYRIECGECGAVVFERTDCPRCGGPGGVERAQGKQHGLQPPPACPRCEHPELKLTAEVRMHAVFVEGRLARRVADAERHEPGFHVTQIDCPSCERTVGKAGADCPLCGRSSLLRRIR